MTPVLYVKVVVDPVVGKSTLNIYKIDLVGSRIAEIANGTFDGACPGRPAGRAWPSWSLSLVWLVLWWAGAGHTPTHTHTHSPTHPPTPTHTHKPTVKARNVVSFRGLDADEASKQKMLMSTVSVQVDAQVPRGNMVRSLSLWRLFCVCVRSLSLWCRFWLSVLSLSLPGAVSGCVCVWHWRFWPFLCYGVCL